MKRFEKCKRILAFLLVTLMIISQSSVITLAEELSLDTRNAQNQEATAVAETPEESEQEPSVPDPDNNDKQEPEEVQPSVPEESPETTETPEPEKDQESSCEEEATIPESTAISADTVAEAPSDVSSQETKTESKEEIAVQDDNTRYTTNLNALATEASVSGAGITQVNGVYQVRPETDYTFKVQFAETEDLQFHNDGDGEGKLYYTLPDGLTIPGSITETAFNIGTLSGNTFSYQEGSNRIVVRLNKNDPNYEEFKKSATAHFGLEFNVRFNADAEEIVFGNAKTIKIYVDINRTLSLKKDASYDASRRTISYTITVSSAGVNNNVVITDNLSGNWLEMYSLDNVVITSNKNRDFSNVTKAINGRELTVTIPSMDHGENIYIKYTVQVVNADQMHPTTKDDAVNATTNTVTGNWSGNNTVSVNKPEVYNPSISKRALLNNSNHEITYTITLNEDFKYDISGRTITDTVVSGSRRFGKYSGGGITVQIYDSTNTLLGSTPVPWSAITAEDSKDYTWAYTIPAEHQGNYKYVITYTVQGDNREITGANFNNDVIYDTGGKASSSVRLIPLDGVLNINKQGTVVTDATGKRQIQWTVSFSVPANKEYTNCTLKDTLPYQQIDNELYSDSYIEGSEQISGLLDGENYEIGSSTTSDGKNELTVKFYYMENGQKKMNLKVSDQARTIQFTYLTEPNAKWLANSNVLTNKSHKNSATISARGQNLTANATVELYENNPDITKSAEVIENDENGNAKVIQYNVTVLGIEGDSIKITDEFNKEHLIYDAAQGLQVSYSDDGKTFTQDQSVTAGATSSDTGMVFTIQNVHPEDGLNHAVYRLTYCLKVNGAAGVDSIETSEEGGKVTNTAFFRGKSTSVKTTVINSEGIINKKLLNEDSLSAEGYVAEYQLVINPGMKTYGTSEMLTVKDIMTNMKAVNPDEVEIHTESAAGTDVDIDKVKAVFSEDGIHFTVPNATKAVITYKAKWTGQGEIEHINEATVYGYSRSVARSVNISSQGSGDFDNYKITIYKVEKDNNTKTLAGATFKLQRFVDGKPQDVLDKDNNIVTITTDTAGKAILEGHDHEKGWVLRKEYKYQLVEIEAPAGYELNPAPTIFAFSDAFAGDNVICCENGGQIIITNELAEHEIEISKVNAADGVTELAGAKLQITDEAGNIVKDKAGNELSWTTGESAEDQNEDGSAKPHKVKLVAGTYILKEVSAPFGYLMADPITFTVGLDGKLSSKAEGAVSNDENKAVVIMKDVAKEKSVSSSISVTKRLKTVAGEDILAADQTFYVALYADQECTQRVSDVKALTFKMDSVSTATFTDLAIDTTYYIGECTADGVNYLKGQTADGTTYTAMFSNGNSVETGSNGGNKAVEFENRFVKFPDGFYKEALLNLTKQLKSSDGEDKNSAETFYAGIFADKDYTKLSDQVSQNIVPLNLNGNSSAGAQIKVAIADGGSTTLYVTEVDADGKPVENADSFEYDLSVDTESITFNESNKSASVTLVNQERAEDEDEETEEEEIKEKTTKNTPTPTSSVTPTKSTQTTNAVKTGDNTPIGIFVVLLIAAIAVIGGGIYLKRRKK